MPSTLVFSVVLLLPAVERADLGAGLGKPFIRGDANLDLGINIADPVFILQGLFLGGGIPCREAADANGDGALGVGLDLSDAAYLLQYLFLGGPLPPSPFPACGSIEPSLGCDETACPTSGCDGDEVVRGCVFQGRECRVLVLDDGTSVELRPGSVPVPPAAWCGTIRGRRIEDPQTLCGVGPIVEVCEAIADEPRCMLELTGCVRQGFECAVFVLDGGGDVELRAGDAPVPPVDWCGTIVGRRVDATNPFCQLTIVEVCEAITDEPECPLTLEGCVVEGVECPVFRTADDEVFELRNGTVPAPPLGWCGVITAEPCRADCDSFCQQGRAVLVCSAEPRDRE